MRQLTLHDIKYDENSISVDGKRITVYSESNAENLPWGELDVDVVLECTGFYTSKEKSRSHINAGAKKVLISAPAGNDLPTIVFGTNEKTLTNDDVIVSGASCTTNCLAPMAKALNNYRELRTGFMTTIHVDPPSHFHQGTETLDCYTPEQMVMPLCVIDITDKIKDSVDYGLTVEDVKACFNEQFLSARSGCEADFKTSAAAQMNDISRCAGRFSDRQKSADRFRFDEIGTRQRMGGRGQAAAVFLFLY